MKGDPRDALAFDPIGSHTYNTDISSATTLTPPAGATKIKMQAVAQNVRYVLDGSTPTAAIGFQLKAGDPPLIIPLGNNTTIKVIQETATPDFNYQWGE